LTELEAVVGIGKLAAELGVGLLPIRFELRLVRLFLRVALANARRVCGEDPGTDGFNEFVQNAIV
jgi:hypothetical protein